MFKKLIKYYRPNCAPCAIMSNTIKEFMLKNSDYLLEEVNVNELTDQQYEATKIKSVPTIKLLDAEGKELGSFVGSAQFAGFTNWVSSIMKTQASK